MRRREVILAGLVACPLISGCSADNNDCLIGDESCTSSAGSSSGGGSCGNDGVEVFNGEVRAILVAACAQCHSSEFSSNGPDFLGASAGDFYGMLTTKSRFVSSSPQNSALLNKGEHTGPAFTSTQHAAVSKWLSIEANERFGACSGVAPSNCKTAEALLAEFGACMTLDDWTTSKMHEISTQTSTFGACHTCHALGAGGNYMTNPVSVPDIELGFDKMRKLSPILNLVAWPDMGPGGECPDIKPSYRWRDKGIDGGEHPKYVLAPEHEAALDAWFAVTYAKWKNGPCP